MPLVALLLFARAATHADPVLGADPITQTSVWSLSATRSAKVGECAVVSMKELPRFTRTIPQILPPIPDASSTVVLRRTPNGATVTLLSLSGKPVARAEAFGIESDGSFPLMAALAIDATMKPDDYELEVAFHPDGERWSVPITVMPSAFKTETIKLSAANAAIQSDRSPKRLAQIDALTALLGTVDSSAPRFLGPFAAPLESKRRTAFFADRRIFRYPGGKREESFHWGIDFGVPIGTKVRASGSGRVAMAESRISTGWTIVIEHAPGIYSLYYHLAALRAKVGDDVTVGDVIGLSGNSGLSTAAHLHWEFRVNGTAVQPDWFVGTTIGGDHP